MINLKHLRLHFANLLRTAALLTALALFTTLSFEALHAGHEANCHDEDCPVCLVLQIIHSTNKIGKSLATATAVHTAFFYINILILSALLIAPATLVKQKVKLVI